jgi:hypothetical protein
VVGYTLFIIFQKHNVTWLCHINKIMGLYVCKILILLLSYADINRGWFDYGNFILGDPINF